ncbi:hypothetical protein V2G26_017603 [Clonostachys chloroleuca]
MAMLPRSRQACLHTKRPQTLSYAKRIYIKQTSDTHYALTMAALSCWTHIVPSPTLSPAAKWTRFHSLQKLKV